MGRERVEPGEGALLASTDIFNEDPVGSGNWEMVLRCEKLAQLPSLMLFEEQGSSGQGFSGVPFPCQGP